MLGRLREEAVVLRYVDKLGGPSFRAFCEGWDAKLFPWLLADAELPNDRLIALGIVSLEVVQ